MIVNPDVVDIYTSLKKTKAPEKRKKTATYWQQKN